MKKSIIFVLFTVLFTIFISSGFGAQAANPASIFYLTWESNGSSPIGYQGKNLASVDCVIKITVQPLIYSGSGYSDPSKWQYRWYLNGEFADVDGVGTRQFRFRAKEYNLDKQEVKVKVTFPNGSIQEKTIVIPIVNPKAVIKTTNGFVVLRNETINTNETEVSLVATPYFFSSAAKLKIKWYENDEYQSGNSSFIVKKTEGDNSHLVKILVADYTDSLIRAIGQIKINFLGI
ncbi:MAG TPA: hypothetical protein PLQ44_02375 [Candidatus Paceibacterota bacterium]|nr:hypothetical protein [Candidatus Paceibacterota bacterium]HPT40425.1 hypothetical protein [Candidatus Paceibacterota bacterium]